MRCFAVLVGIGLLLAGCGNQNAPASAQTAPNPYPTAASTLPPTQAIEPDKLLLEFYGEMEMDGSSQRVALTFRQTGEWEFHCI